MEPNLKMLPFRRRGIWRTVAARFYEQTVVGVPADLREELRGRILDLPGVVEAPSRVPGVAGARAFLLEPEYAGGPPKAYLSEGEFAFLNPLCGDALHLALPRDLSDEAVVKGWGEMRPVAGDWGTSPIAFVAYDPKDEDELDSVWRIVLASYEFARGSTARSQQRAERDGAAVIPPRLALAGAAGVPSSSNAGRI